MSVDAIRQLPRPLYQPIELPEFVGEAVLQPCVERWNLMQPHLPKPGVMVDYGCHTGWMCRQFARNGWRAYGYDKSSEYLMVAEQMNGETGLACDYFHRDILDNQPVLHSHVSLCLSVAMYLFDNENDGWGFFHRASEASPLMFCDFGGMYSGRLPFGEANVVEMFLDKTTYTHGQLIGRTAFENRPFFKFWR